MFGIYRTLTYVASPLIDIYLNRRKKKGREDNTRFDERLGIITLPRPAGRLLWFHAASIGEAASILSLINLLLIEYKDINILVTTGTVTSARLLGEKLPQRSFHQYVPVDRPGAVRKFIKYWQPEAAFWVESELWPNLIIEAKKNNIKMLLLNGRISDTSFRLWGYLRPFAGKLLSAFSLCLAQSELDAERLRKLGAGNVKYLGNLKYDSASLPAEPKDYAALIKAAGERPRWLAASTHPGEEMLIKKAHLQLKKQYPDLLTIIVPRHPVRGAEIEAEFKELKTSLRSRDGIFSSDSEVYIADTIGELGLFYRLSEITLMGGSLVKHGGQNPLEPARLENAIITGRHYHNFKDIYQQMAAKNAVIIIESAKELASTVSRLLASYDITAKFAASALEFTEEKSGVAESYLQEIKSLLK